MHVTQRQHEGDGAAEIIGQGVDFRRPSAARGANGVIKSPPFAPAAERCALTWVESTLPLKTTDFRTPTPKLSITHNSRGSNLGADFDVREPRETAPDHDVTRRLVAGPSEVAAEASKFCKVE